MILDVKQLSKELFAASFVIKRGLAEVGKISVQGRFGSMEATINGVFKGQYFEMDYIKNPIFKNRYDFRKYVISDNGYENGTVCQTERYSQKEGINYLNEPELFVDFEPDADWALDWDEIPKDIQDSVELVRFLMKKDGDGLPVKSKENWVFPAWMAVLFRKEVYSFPLTS